MDRAESADGEASFHGERRWPMAVAVVSVAMLQAALPSQLQLVPTWIVSVLVLVGLGVLIAGDPGRIDQRKRWLSVATTTLIGFITVANAFAAGMLIAGIINNASFTQPDELLFSGGAIWISNVIAFALWYWDLDSGGPAERAHGTGPSPALIFPEMNNSHLVRADWYPKFVDYFAFSFATATAFSPTDVSAIKPWAKLMMVCEALISLAVATLVIARAVNVIQ